MQVTFSRTARRFDLKITERLSLRTVGRVGCLLLLHSIRSNSASADTPSVCFDFSKPVTSALTPPKLTSGEKSTQHARSKTDVVVSGKHPKSGGWATAKGKLEYPIDTVLAVLREQTTLKDPDDCDLSFEHQKRPGMLDFQTVDVTIHPFPLISIRWQEEWGYAVTQGTAEQPKQVLISYQKVSGTDHIRRFCGNITLTATGAGATEILIYEETDASRRSHEDIAIGHEGTLRTVREKAAKLGKKNEPSVKAKPSSLPSPSPKPESPH